jgi:hypothetical protein
MGDERRMLFLVADKVGHNHGRGDVDALCLQEIGTDLKNRLLFINFAKALTPYEP